MPEVTCSIVGCNRRPSSRGWCNAHYLRWKRYGDPLRYPAGNQVGQRATQFWEAVRQANAISATSPLDTLDDTAFGHWLAGFLDGEGCFSIVRRGGTQCHSTRMHVILRADDISLLDAIHRRTSIGTLCYSAHKSRLGRPGVTWTVVSKPDCIRLAELLDAHPLMSKKARDYAIWRRAVEVWSSVPLGRRGQDWLAMATLKKELEAVRTFVSPAEPQS
jgi:LAGLIDADG endonuclease